MRSLSLRAVFCSLSGDRLHRRFLSRSTTVKYLSFRVQLRSSSLPELLLLCLFCRSSLTSGDCRFLLGSTTLALWGLSFSLDELLLFCLFSWLSLRSCCPELSSARFLDDNLLSSRPSRCRPSVFTASDLPSLLDTSWCELFSKYEHWLPSSAGILLLSRLTSKLLPCLCGLWSLLCSCEVTSPLLSISSFTLPFFSWPATYFLTRLRSPLPKFLPSSGNSDFTRTNGEISLCSETRWLVCDGFTASLLGLLDWLLSFFLSFFFFFFFSFFLFFFASFSSAKNNNY